MTFGAFIPKILIKNRNMEKILKKVKRGINEYLKITLKKDKVDQQTYEIAKKNVPLYLEEWLMNKNIEIISPNVKEGIKKSVEKKEWENIINAFWKKMSFGTGGIRGLMASDKKSIIKLKKEGIDARILKGPNTLNNIVLLQTSVGVAKFGLGKGFKKIVIGYDSRVRGFDFAKSIAELFLAYGYRVYLFDAPCPYPEVTFAIPYKKIKAQLGILISASHNDYRYNGYKLSCGNGSQFDLKEREEMYNKYIVRAKLDEIKLLSLKKADEGQLIFLGGEKPISGFDYAGHKKSLIDIHAAHRQHVKKFLLKNPKKKMLNIDYCAFHGAGRVAVPRLLKDLNYKNIKIITKKGLNNLDGLFPCFDSRPGKERQPDPGDARAASIEVEAFKEEHPKEWQKIDILIGTDPDADRCGVVVKIPPEKRFLYDEKDYQLISADEMWSLLIWYRLKFDKKINLKETFLATTTTTTDCLVKLALKYRLGVVRTWVGFANLATAVRDVWDKKNRN